MKKNERKDLKSKSKEELITMIDKLRSEIKKIVVERNCGRLKNVSLLRVKKRNIACILTIQREKELIEK